ncbi:MAG: succinate dehydrogenase cytochrome b subunit [Bdellovibrionota bacterium]
MGYFTSAIGRKQIMGVTGIAWSLFVLSHMAGNLLIFVGPDAYNKYSHALISNPLLIVAELGLVVTLLLHVVNGVMLTLENRAARPQKYAMPTNGAKKARFQSKYMAFHGTLILVFIILHLITFKYGTHYTTVVDGVEMRDLHRLIMEVFQSPGYVFWYVICVIGVGLHLSHGFYSSFASLGVFHPRLSGAMSKLGYIYAFIVAAGFLAQPLYVFAVAR